jgi:hypothetical protein
LSGGAPLEVIEPSLEQLKVSDPAAYGLFQRYGRSTARRLGDALRVVGDLFLSTCGATPVAAR